MGRTLRRSGFCNAALFTTWTALASFAVGTAFVSAASAAVVSGEQATFTWLPASGPVVGYDVFVIRNGTSTGSAEQSVSGSTVTISGQLDDRISVQVAAFDAAGNHGPLSAQSEVVLLVAAPPPAIATASAAGDFSIQDALAVAQPGEQVVAHMLGSEKQFLDAAPDPAGGIAPEDWGLDQLVVGQPNQPTEVRLLDAIGLDGQFPLANLPQLNLFGLGNGAPCARDGGTGLVIHPGSRLILGGIDLYAFDGQDCVYVNDLFLSSADPNLVAWGDGEIQLDGDIEGDGVLDPDDNCLLVANADQCDGDRDGFGSACDTDLNGNQAGDLNDVALVHEGMRAVSRDPVLDLNCDGAVGMDDVGLAMAGTQQIQGPSGLACAADATCFGP